MKKINYSNLKAVPEKENFSGKYENNSVIARQLVDNYFKAVSRLMAKTEHVKLAHEVGVGEGYSTIRLYDMVPNLTASEFVETMVRKAQKNNPKVKIFQESVYELQYLNESVDVVFLLEVLEHLDYPELALKELKRISKRYLILGVPNEPLWRILNFMRFKYMKEFGNTPGHLNHWSTKSLVSLIEKNFGKVIEVETPIPWTIVLAEKE